MTFDRRAFLAALAFPTAARAQAEPVLELAGAIAAPSPRRLRRSELETLGQAEFLTATRWTRGPHRFAGVPLGALLDRVGAQGQVLRMAALNDYAIVIPRAAAIAAEALLATRMDGQAISVRDRGPFWLVFPWSTRPDLDTALVRQWAIWQLARIEVA